MEPGRRSGPGLPVLALFTQVRGRVFYELRLLGLLRSSHEVPVGGIMLGGGKGEKRRPEC